MAFEFKLPDIGEGVVEGELTKWLVEEGQQVLEDAPLFEVLTDKVSAVIPSPRVGTVLKRHFQEGDMVPVGAVVVTIDEAAGASADKAAKPVEPTPAASGPSDAAPVAKKPADPKVSAPAVSAPAVSESAPEVAVAAPAQTSARAEGDRVRAAPATRKLARDLGVDLAAVAGSGEAGRVTKADVESLAHKISTTPVKTQEKSAVAPTALAKGADEERVKLKGLRRKIYAKMRESKDHAAHFTYVDEVDFTAIIDIQNVLNQNGLKATFLPFVVKAVVLSLQKPEFAYLNAQIDEAAGEILLKKRFHIGIAAATEAGLVVPVVRDCDQKSIRQLIDSIHHLGEGARTQSLTAEEMTGSTFTITSLGKLGGMFATPIINYPESAILGLHKVERRPAVVDGQIVIRDRMYMSCSFDHRLIDGHVGAAFVQSVKTYLEQPALLLADLV